ncbi:hypothetical protein PIB30_046795 [Stylosanthes scabra]|uniref:R13L1/DRL21-like LRR repeat region domain-containing protein n=1 Tax=Stylosanthes scabra TaxID=79078 RepID=A0ABU6QHB7_9FABA|nr:hypothetical protein [Stylosanthes scabra]
MLPNGMCNLLNLRHLDIWGTPLKEMPKGMGKLKQLYTLSYYIERRARILDKKHIDELLLKWSSADMVSDLQIEGDILNSLRPHTSLKELRIEGYKGVIFPNWMGQHSYHNMTYVSLKSCKNCRKLPSLGQLPSLKSLRVEGFSELKCIGDEFYKNEDDPTLHVAPFPSLETLQFEDKICDVGRCGTYYLAQKLFLSLRSFK